MPNQITSFPIDTTELAGVSTSNTVDALLAVDDGDVVQADPVDVLSSFRPSYLPSPIKLVAYDLSANTTYTFTTTNSTKAVAFLTGANSNNMSMTLINVTGSGTVSRAFFPNSTATSPIELTANGTNSMTITTNANATYICFLVFGGSVVKD